MRILFALSKLEVGADVMLRNLIYIRGHIRSALERKVCEVIIQGGGEEWSREGNRQCEESILRSGGSLLLIDRDKNAKRAAGHGESFDV